MKKTLVVVLAAAFLSAAPAFAGGPITAPLPRTASPHVIVIPVNGTVDAAMAAFIGRSLKEREKYSDRVVVLEMDTYGGEVDAAFRIVDTMLTVHDCPTIAYVKTKAISAGSLIALSCNRLIMQRNTTIGDCAPLMMGQEGPKMLGEKFQSPIRAKFRILAKANGYPERLTEAMVTEGMLVQEVKLPDTVMYLDSTELAGLPAETKKKIVSSKAVVKHGELLTMDDLEARNLGFSRASVADMDEMFRQLGWTEPQVIRLERNWSEELVRLISFAAPFLMMIGLALLYIEFKHPGLLAPGIIGGLCLALVFFGQYMVGLANYTDILLVVLGVGLVFAEILLFPSMGFLLAIGTALIFVSLVLALQGFVLPKPEFPWQQHTLVITMGKVLGSFVAAGVLAFLFVRYAIPGLSTVVKGPYLSETLHDARVDLASPVSIAAGDAGVVLTALRPAGRAKIKGEEYDVVADGEFIEKGAAIKVLQVQGPRVVVVRDKSV